jgi:transposase
MHLIDMDSTEHTSTTPSTSEKLPDDVATLQDMVRELLASLRQQQHNYEALRHQIDLLLRRLYGPRTERFDPSQLLLFEEPASPADTTAPLPDEAIAESASRRCRPHGRRRLPDKLPREVRHHELPEAARLCATCGQKRIDIGVDKSEQLEYRPASLLVIEHVVHKYVCPCCSRQSTDGRKPSDAPGPQAGSLPSPQPQAASETPVAMPAGETMTSQPEPENPNEQLKPLIEASPTPTSAAAAEEPSPIVIAASKPASPIAKGLPGPGLLAHLIVSKHTDHLPLHRLERIYERQGVFIPRSTLCDWLAASAALLRPLYDLMVRVVLQSRALHTDDTTVKMQDPRTHRLSTARLWVYLGDVDHPYNFFDFTVNHRRDGPQQFLADYQGYLHADAFSGYDGLYLPNAGTATPRIIEVACNAHARRKFYETRSSDALRSHQALAYYRQLYELERSAQRNGFDDTQRLQMRQELSLPILTRFQQWLESQRADVLPKSPLGEALGYALKNWTALVRYTEAGFLAIDNNVAEREMKRIAIGRKNWLFVGSQKGGQTAAVLFSFTSTCQRLGVEPWAYLQDVLTRLPETNAGQLGDLLPDHWQAARPSAMAAPPVVTTEAITPSIDSAP